MLKAHNKVDHWNVLKTRLVSTRMKATNMAFLTVATLEFRILNKIGAGGFSRVYEVHLNKPKHNDHSHRISICVTKINSGYWT